MGLARSLSTGQVGRQAAGLEGVSAQSPCAAPCGSTTNCVRSWAPPTEVTAMASALRGASQLFAKYVRTHKDTHSHLHKANTHL